MGAETQLEELKKIFKDGLNNIANILNAMLSVLMEDELLGVVETYELTASTSPQTLWPPADKSMRRRHKWLWVQIINDSETVNVRIGVNAGEASSLIVYAGENIKIDFRDRKKIEYLTYKTDSGEACIRVICTM